MPSRPSDIRVREARVLHVAVACRTPLKFGAVVVEEVPIAFARVTVENRAGRTALGWGAMFLVDLWAWPASRAGHAAKSRLMCALAAAYAKAVVGYGGFAHPIEVFMETKADLGTLSARLSSEHTPGEQMPLLGALVCASAVDHAVHDAFGNVNGIDSYLGGSSEWMAWDLSRYLGREFSGLYPCDFLRDRYAPEVPVFHLVGGLDPLRRSDRGAAAPRDGLPVSLDEWIERDGVFCLKVKLRGRDLEWDLARTIGTSEVYHEVRRSLGSLPERPNLSVDTNEQCESPDYVLEYLHKLRERAPRVLEEVLYVEQPTERDLAAHRWDMRPVARCKPIIVDESLASLEDFDLALDLGWSGVALKSCKCLSANLLFVARAEKAGVPYTVQDLTCPSISLIQSVGLAARTRPLCGVEANSRQYFPAANRAEAAVHPGISEIRQGRARTESIRGTGLGLRVKEIDRPEFRA